MKKSKKILLCISAGCVGLGIVLTGISLALGANPAHALGNGIFNFTIMEKRTSQVSQDGRYVIPRENISELLIDWGNGNIEVETYDGEEIILQEECAVPLNEDNALMYKKTGNTLKISSAPGRSGIYFTEARKEHKQLHLYLPKTMEWERVRIDALCTEIHMKDVHAGKLDVDILEDRLHLSDVRLGEIELDGENVLLEIMNSEVRKIDVDAVRSSLNAVLRSCPSSLEVDTTGGEIDLTLPGQSGFTLHMDTVSCKLDSQFAGTYQGEDYIVGDGTARFEIDAVDSAVRIQKLPIG